MSGGRDGEEWRGGRREGDDIQDNIIIINQKRD